MYLKESILRNTVRSFHYILNAWIKNDLNWYSVIETSLDGSFRLLLWRILGSLISIWAIALSCIYREGNSWKLCMRKLLHLILLSSCGCSFSFSECVISTFTSLTLKRQLSSREVINKTFLLPNTLLEANIDFQYLPCKPSLIGNS